MIGILDYGLGNIRAFSNIYKFFDIPHRIIQNKEELDGVKKLILPGVGAFDHAMKKFNSSGLRDKVEKMVLVDKAPILGVCVGLQMFAETSDEGKERGLGWINSKVKIFDESLINYDTKLPHMGWNSINFLENQNPLFSDLKSGQRFYFLHSYFFECEYNNILATCEYGEKFTCAAKAGNIYGVQFHPEKSLINGEKLLYNFAVKINAPS